MLREVGFAPTNRFRGIETLSANFSRSRAYPTKGFFQTFWQRKNAGDKRGREGGRDSIRHFEGDGGTLRKVPWFSFIDRLDPAWGIILLVRFDSVWLDFIVCSDS